MRKLFTMAGIAMLSILMGIPALVGAQDEPKPQRQEEPKPEPRQEPRPEARPQPDARQQEEKPPKQEETKPPKHDDKRPEQAQQPERMPQTERPQQNAARPANGRGGHIPDDKFRAHFGRAHTVVVRQPVVVEGQPRFQYSGYWFVIADPWPPDWAYTDECYIDDVDGEYFLFDLLHPGVRVALFVVM